MAIQVTLADLEGWGDGALPLFLIFSKFVFLLNFRTKKLDIDISINNFFNLHIQHYITVNSYAAL